MALNGRSGGTTVRFEPAVSIVMPCSTRPAPYAAPTATAARVRCIQIHPIASGMKANDTAVAVAARKATKARSTTSRRCSSNDTMAHGATATNAQMVLVVLAVFSAPAAGIRTTSDASASRTGTDETHVRDAW